MAKKKALPIEGLGKNSDALLVQKSLPLTALWQSDLTLAEFKILDTYLSRINSRDPDKREVVLEKGKLEELLGVKRINLTDLDTRLLHLQKTVVNLKRNGKGIDHVTLFERSQAELDEFGRWRVVLTCTQSAMKYIFNIEALGYLRYRVHSITNLKSRYTYLLFMHLEVNRFRKSWEVDLETLKACLNCADEAYKEFKIFNNRILKRCQKELLEKTECRFTYEPIRKGRSVAAIRFTLETLPELDVPDIDLDQISLFSDDNLDFLGAACAPTADEPCEFSEEQMAQLREVVMVMPDGKLPTNVPNGDMQFRRYHYLSERYAALNAAAIRAEKQGNPIKNRFAYLLKMVKADAGIE